MAADLTPLYYITGTGASIAAVLGGARSYYQRQRKRWTSEGAQQERHAKALEANTRASERNTATIERLGTKLDGFIDEARRELLNHTSRIGHLEDLVENNFRQQPRRPPRSEGTK
jgi:hypothetical protein